MSTEIEVSPPVLILDPMVGLALVQICGRGEVAPGQNLGFTAQSWQICVLSLVFTNEKRGERSLARPILWQTAILACCVSSNKITQSFVELANIELGFHYNGNKFLTDGPRWFSIQHQESPCAADLTLVVRESALLNFVCHSALWTRWRHSNIFSLHNDFFQAFLEYHDVNYFWNAHFFSRDMGLFVNNTLQCSVYQHRQLFFVLEKKSESLTRRTLVTKRGALTPTVWTPQNVARAGANSVLQIVGRSRLIFQRRRLGVFPCELALQARCVSSLSPSWRSHLLTTLPYARTHTHTQISGLGSWVCCADNHSQLVFFRWKTHAMCSLSLCLTAQTNSAWRCRFCLTMPNVQTVNL